MKKMIHKQLYDTKGSPIAFPWALEEPSSTVLKALKEMGHEIPENKECNLSFSCPGHRIFGYGLDKSLLFVKK